MNKIFIGALPLFFALIVAALAHAQDQSVAEQHPTVVKAGEVNTRLKPLIDGVQAHLEQLSPMYQHYDPDEFAKRQAAGTLPKHYMDGWVPYEPGHDPATVAKDKIAGKTNEVLAGNAPVNVKRAQLRDIDTVAAYAAENRSGNTKLDAEVGAKLDALDKNPKPETRLTDAKRGIAKVWDWVRTNIIDHTPLAFLDYYLSGSEKKEAMRRG